jgi:hypothetical protein
VLNGVFGTGDGAGTAQKSYVQAHRTIIEPIPPQ